MKVGENVPGGAIMLIMIFLCFISCGTHNPKYILPREPVMNIMPVVVVDTPQLLKTAKALKIDPELKDLINKNEVAEVSNDKLLEYNLRWQDLTLRLLDSARNRKRDKDSVYAILKGFKKETRQQLDSMRQENKQAFLKQKNNSQLVNSTFSMFDILGTICFILIALTYIVYWGERIFSKYKRPKPAL